jgi:uncharacterized protein YcfJ
MPRARHRHMDVSAPGTAGHALAARGEWRDNDASPPSPEARIAMKKLRPIPLALLLIASASARAQSPPPAPAGAPAPVPAQAPPAGKQLAITAKKGQSAAQTQADVGSCQADARTRAGADPAEAIRNAQAPAATTPKATKGGVGKGALGGAAAGAVIGEIADDDAGTGAAIGAGVGAIAGGVRRNKAEQEAEAQRQAAEQEKAARQQAAAKQIEQYNAAFKACLEGRGYSVQ